MGKPLVFHHAGVIDGVDLYIETEVKFPPDVSLYTGWTKVEGFRVDPHVCTQWCIHDPVTFGAPDFKTRGLSYKEFTRFVDALNKIRKGIDAGNLRFLRLLRTENGRFTYVEVDPRVEDAES